MDQQFKYRFETQYTQSFIETEKIYILKARKTDINKILICVFTCMAHTNGITLEKT